MGFPEEQDDVKRLINVADQYRTLREEMGIDRNGFADIARDLIPAIPVLVKIVKDAQGITLGAPTESAIPAPIDELAVGLADDDWILRSERGRNERFGYDGMRKLVRGLMRRAALSGFTGHNLRGTFATLVTEESGDLTLAMQLIRDRVPGVAFRYVKRDLPALLERYSPVRQLERKPSPLVGESGVLVGESLVETGES